MILSTSDIKKNIRHRRVKYIVASLFCAIFGIIYEHFSHNVYSNFMIFAFAIPLSGGIFADILGMINIKKAKGACDSNLFSLTYGVLAGAVIWLTLSCIVRGVLDIYGTTNHLLKTGTAMGIAQLVFAILLAFICVKRNH